MQRRDGRARRHLRVRHAGGDPRHRRRPEDPPGQATYRLDLVAGDGTGNHYVIDTSRTHLPADAVFFVDVMEDPAAPCYIVASTLTHFLTALLRKELGNRAWPFDQSYVATTDPALLPVHPSVLLPWNAP